jgi:hypothetical protein
MARHATHNYFGRYNFTLILTIAFVVLGLAAYFGVVGDGNSRFLPDGISGPAAASQMSNSNASSLAALGYFGVAEDVNSRFSSAGVSGKAAASQMSSSNAATGTADLQGGGVATTAVPPAAQREVGYFPNVYVNQATQIEDPIATF